MKSFKRTNDWQSRGNKEAESSELNAKRTIQESHFHVNKGFDDTPIIFDHVQVNEIRNNNWGSICLHNKSVLFFPSKKHLILIKK